MREMTRGRRTTKREGMIRPGNKVENAESKRDYRKYNRPIEERRILHNSNVPF
jgi:hypothetical protein